MPLLKQLLKVNKWLVEATTPMFYIIGAITMFVLGAVSLSSETVAFKPELPISNIPMGWYCRYLCFHCLHDNPNDYIYR